MNTPEERNLRGQLGAALELLETYGWVPLGTNLDTPGRLEFSPQVGEDGLPWFERHVDVS